MAKNKIQGKAKAKLNTTTAAFAANMFEAVADMDGNPNSPAEFDDTPHTDEEMYFNPPEGATEADKNRCKVLNYIHRRLRGNLHRTVPPVTGKEAENVEIYHRETYMGDTFEVCAYFPVRVADGFKDCVAVVKLVATDLESDDAPDHVVSSHAAWTSDAQKDKYTLTVDKINANYWTPRWVYIVKYVRERMAKDFDKYGTEVHVEVESEIPRGTDLTKSVGAGGADGVVDTGIEMEEVMQVFSGATGKIIGPKGSKIHEIKDATHVVDIQMPSKSEDGSRPRARELVNITLKGTRTQINKAKVMIQEVVDEWANAPRPPRDGGGGFSSTYVNPDPIPDYNAMNGGSGGGQGGADAGGELNWADDANNEASSGEAGWSAPAATSEW